MNASRVLDKWVEGTLTEDEIFFYLLHNVVSMDPQIDPKTTVHVAECCFQIYQWHTGKIPYLSEVFEAIAQNDLKKTMEYAGPTLRHGGLWAIMIFLYNCAPRGWEKKLK